MHEATPLTRAVPVPGAGHHHTGRLVTVRACRSCKAFGSVRVVEHPSGPVLVCMECGVAARQVDRGWATRALSVAGR